LATTGAERQRRYMQRLKERAERAERAGRTPEQTKRERQLAEYMERWREIMPKVMKLMAEYDRLAARKAYDGLAGTAETKQAKAKSKGKAKGKANARPPRSGPAR
jgi:hypothetical protein